MKQYIKKTLWIIPFVFSLNLSGATYYYNGTGSVTTPGSWIGSGRTGAATSFGGGHSFDCAGFNIDIAGITITGAVTFQSGSAATISNSGTVYITSQTAPVFNTSNLTLNFNSTGTTFSYEYSHASLYQTIAPLTYYNLHLKNSNKSINSSLTIDGDFKEFSGYQVNITKNISLTSGSSITASSSPITVFEISGDGDVPIDNRSNKLFPGKWTIVKSGLFYFPQGTYDQLILSSFANNIHVMKGNTTITNSISASTSGQRIDITDIGNSPDQTLTISGTQSGNPIFIIGDLTANLVINSGNSFSLYMDQDVNTNLDYTNYLKNLSVENGSTVTLNNWLNIAAGSSSSSFGVIDVKSSSTFNTGGYLTLKSNQYGTAMIGNIAGTLQKSSGNNIGTLLIENFIPSASRGRQYRFLSAPVSGGLFLQWRDSMITVSGSARTGRGTHITGDYTKTLESGSAIDSFDLSTTNHPSAFTYDETKAGSVTGISTTLGAKEDPGWSRLSQANDNSIVNGKGYRILIRGDRTISLTSAGSNFTPNNTTLQTRGGYVSGPVTVPITNSGSNTNNGINLIGNPYACAVDWKEVYNASSNVDASYVLYDPLNKVWQAYNAASSTPSVYRYISPGQGFLVYTSNPTTSGGGGGGSVVFPLICKTTSDAGSRTFTEIKTNHLITHLRRDTTASDMNIIYFLGGATNYYDKYDAGHIQNEYVNLSSLDSTNTLYNINCLDSLVGQRIVPLSVYGTPKGTYTMAFDDVNTFRNHDVFLVDNFLKKTTKVDDFTQYNVEITEDKFSYAEGRFYISFEPKVTSSIVSLTKTENFNINPNPVKDIINIKSQKSITGNIQYEIFNINGQLISKGILNESETRINSTNLSKGIYFITLKTNSETQTIKFIK